MADGFVATMDGWMRDAALGVYEYFTLGWRALRFGFSRPFYWRDMLLQMDRLGVGSLPIVLLTGVFTGMVLALQSSTELATYGANSFLGSLVGDSMVQEIGPVLTGLGVAGRVGSGIAAEIGSMRITEQVDALQTFGTDPIRKLVTPRLLACLIMVPLITILMDLVGIIGGLVIATSSGVPADVFLRSMWAAFAYEGFIFGIFPKDFIPGIVKPFVFGGVVAITGSYYGLAASGGAESVGTATTRTVVVSSILIFALDYFLTQLLMVLFGPAAAM
ncbi:MAG TPA: ABC transporter permease [Longimicrobiales bacterium]|nr:ABC transporter permease [Longimicrobiales bacterium]